MSETQTVSDSDVEQATEEYEKDVSITAYSDGSYDSGREFIDDIVGDLVDIDVNATRVKQDRKVEFKLDLEWEDEDGYTDSFSQTISPFMSKNKRVVRNFMKKWLDAGNELPEFISYTDSVESKEEFEHSTRRVIRGYLGDVVDNDVLADLGFSGRSSRLYINSWYRTIADTAVDAEEDAEITQYCRLDTNGTVKRRKPLVHKSKRTKQNRYESDEELWSFSIKAHIECSTPEELEEISQKLVPPMYDALWNIEGIDTVRMESCEQSLKQRGECYNI